MARPLVSRQLSEGPQFCRVWKRYPKGVFPDYDGMAVRCRELVWEKWETGNSGTIESGFIMQFYFPFKI
jgi:hypothetical protein